MVPFDFDSQQVEAATTTQYVNAKGDIYLRDAANSKAKKIAVIKNHSAISVISSKGWSYVQFGKQKGYVHTSALSKKDPKENQVISGGMSPKVGLTLTYSPDFESTGSATYKVQQVDENRKKCGRHNNDYTHLYASK